MIGEDQVKGYSENEEANEMAEAHMKEAVESTEKNKFEESKKKALAMIGRADELDISEEEKKELTESIGQNQEEKTTMKVTSLQHDIIAMRGQVNEMVNVFNRMQIGLKDHFTRINNRLNEIESNFNKRLSDFESKLERR